MPGEWLCVLPMVAGKRMGTVPREPSHGREMRLVLEEIGGLGFVGRIRQVQAVRFVWWRGGSLTQRHRLSNIETNDQIPITN
jgi:hypothetical protein